MRKTGSGRKEDEMRRSGGRSARKGGRAGAAGEWRDWSVKGGRRDGRKDYNKQAQENLSKRSDGGVCTRSLLRIFRPHVRTPAPRARMATTQAPDRSGASKGVVRVHGTRYPSAQRAAPRERQGGEDEQFQGAWQDLREGRRRVSLALYPEYVLGGTVHAKMRPPARIQMRRSPWLENGSEGTIVSLCTGIGSPRRDRAFSRMSNGRIVEAGARRPPRRALPPSIPTHVTTIPHVPPRTTHPQDRIASGWIPSSTPGCAALRIRTPHTHHTPPPALHASKSAPRCYPSESPRGTYVGTIRRPYGAAARAAHPASRIRTSPSHATAPDGPRSRNVGRGPQAGGETQAREPETEIVSGTAGRGGWGGREEERKGKREGWEKGTQETRRARWSE
ncbi:hypothetical protein B0H11DRAFT_1940310 [Mycena galericulata]|nr:hypothetical protein B0H11DRAFT_1940310 [Mycena galericulata]